MASKKAAAASGSGDGGDLSSAGAGGGTMNAKERRVLQIEEAIDRGEYRAALSKCAQRDIAGLASTKTLKALALAKIGDDGEALNICAEIMSSKPSDPKICKTLGRTLLMCGETLQVSAMYANALEKNPSDVSLALELYFAHTRNGDTVAQKKAAMTLVQLTKDVKYYVWTAMAMVAQAPRTGQDRNLMFAQALMKKAMLPDTERNAEALGVYIYLCVRQGALEEAAEALHGPYNTTEPRLLQPVDELHYEAYLALAAENWVSAYGVFKRLLEEHDADDWAYYNGLISSLARIPVEVHGKDGQPSVASTRSLITSLQSSANSRGSFLAEILLEAHLIESGTYAAASELSDAHTRFATLVVAYFRKFGTRPCVFHDLKRFLPCFALPSVAPLPTPPGGSSLQPPAVDIPCEPLPDKTPLPFAFRLEESAASLLRDELAACVAEDCRPSLGWQAALDAAKAAAAETEAGPASHAAGTDASAAGAGGASGTEESSTSERPALSEQESVVVKEASASLRRYCSTHEIRRYLGYHTCDNLDFGAAKALARMFVEDWSRCKPLRDAGEGGSGDLPGDELALLACHVLRDLAARCFTDGTTIDGAAPEDGAPWSVEVSSKDSVSDMMPADAGAWQFILEAIGLLALARKASPSNPQFKLLQLRLYSWLGSGMCAVDCWNDLQPKHIQVDTLPYLVNSLFARSGCFGVLANVCSAIDRMHTLSERDIADHTRVAFEHSSYSKILDFSKFANRLGSSLGAANSRAAYAACTFMNSNLTAVSSSIVRSTTPGRVFGLSAEGMDSTRDNSDFDAEYNWDPEVSSAADLEAIRSHLISCVKYRHHLFAALKSISTLDKDAGSPSLAKELRASVSKVETYLSPELVGFTAALGSTAPSVTSAGAGGPTSGSTPTTVVPSERRAYSAATLASVAPWRYGDGYCTVRPAVRTQLRQLILDSFAMLLAVHAASQSKSPEYGAATEAISSLSAGIASVVDTIVAGRLTPSPDPASCGAGGSNSSSKSPSLNQVFHPRFTAEAGSFVMEVMAVAPVTAFACSLLLPKAPKKKGGKKGKSSGGGAANPAAACQDALANLATVLTKGTAPLVAALTSGPSDKSKLSGDSYGYFQLDRCVTGVQDMEGADAAFAAIVKDLSTGYGDACGQVKEYLTARQTIVRAIR